jgi:chaperonin cofactor prefoldin
MASTGGKRVLTRDLEARVSETERRLAELADHLQKLDERVQKIANSLVQQPLRT